MAITFTGESPGHGYHVKISYCNDFNATVLVIDMSVINTGNYQLY